MAETQPRRRSSDSDDGVHWEITRQHANDISDLKESNARQEEVLSSVLRSQEAMRDAIDTLVHRVSEPPPATDLAKLIGTTVTVLTMFGALVFAYLSPISDEVEQVNQDINTINKWHHQQQYKNGVNDAEMAALKSHLGKALGE